MPPIHPCGMAVDRKRYCVRQKMRFWRDSEQLVEIQWYFVDEGTPHVPFPGPFRSRDFAKPDEIQWYDAKTWKGVCGETYYGPRIRVLGDRPPLAPPFAGDAPCGRPDQWLDGSTIDTDPPLVAGLGGWPVCCDGVPLSPPPPPPPCPVPSYVVEIAWAPDTDDCRPFNRTWLLCQVPGFPYQFNQDITDPLGRHYRVTLGINAGLPVGQGVLFVEQAFLGGSFAQYDYSDPGFTFLRLPITGFRVGGAFCGAPPTQDMVPYSPYLVLATQTPVALANEAGQVLTTEGLFLPPLE